MGSYDRKDRLYRQAKAEGYRSRAAYKLLELDKKLKLLVSGARVLDLGAYPGGWLQVAAERAGKKGIVVGVDLREIEPLPSGSVHLITGDCTAPETLDKIRALAPEFDIVLSDMSPHLTGVTFADVYRSAELVSQASRIAASLLRPGGAFIAKIFPGPDADILVKELRPSFKKISRENLDASRKTSNEYYLVCKSYIPKR